MDKLYSTTGLEGLVSDADNHMTVGHGRH